MRRTILVLVPVVAMAAAMRWRRRSGRRPSQPGPEESTKRAPEAGAERTTKAEPEHTEREPILWVTAVAAALLAVALLAALLSITFVYTRLADRNIFFPDIALPMLLLAGAVLFFLAIAVLANVYQRLGLHDPEHALGLPDGSVRAIIALILIFLFFVAVTFIYASMSRGGPERSLRGLTPAQFAQIPLGDIISSTPNPPIGDPNSYDVVLRSGVSEVTEDIAQNVIVLLGTLVTAVAAFYFGSNAVKSAATSTVEALRGRHSDQDETETEEQDEEADTPGKGTKRGRGRTGRTVK